MEYYEVHCKKCDKKLLQYSKSSFRHYKSPVKICKKCGTRYADPRNHEIALEGIPADTYSITSYAIMTAIGAFVLYRGIHLFGMHQLGTPDSMQWFMPGFITLVGVGMTLGGLIEVLTIVTGIKRRRFDRLAAESEKRMEDKSYVYILQDLGYYIPEKYL